MSTPELAELCQLEQRFLPGGVVYSRPGDTPASRAISSMRAQAVALVQEDLGRGLDDVSERRSGSRSHHARDHK